MSSSALPPSEASAPPGATSLPPGTTSLPPGATPLPAGGTSAPPGATSAPANAHSPPPGTTSIRASGLSFSYRGDGGRRGGAAASARRRGVEAIDLEVRGGEIVTVLGPNGSGKSTLLRLLGTGLRAGAGRVEYRLAGSTGPLSLPDLRRLLGQAADEPVHVEALSVLENALFFGRAAGLSRSEAALRIRPLLSAFGLADDVDVPASACSFGMRRKLLLVQALAAAPPVLLLDEPTIGLDPRSLQALERLLRERAQAGAAVLVATNDVAWAARVASRVAFLHEGRKVADAPPATLLAELEGRTEIEFRTGAGTADAAGAAADFPGDCTLTALPGRLLVDAPGPEVLPSICRTLLDAGVEIRAVRVTPPTLADIFRRLTGAELAEGKAAEGVAADEASPDAATGDAGETA